MIYARAATIEDAQWLSTRLRTADLTELRQGTGREPEEVLEESVAAATTAITVLSDGKPVAMFGVEPVRDFGTYGSVWLRSAPLTGALSKWMLTHAREFLDHFTTLYPDGLVAYASVQNSTHLKWLTATGFSFWAEFDLGGGRFITAIRDPQHV